MIVAASVSLVACQAVLGEDFSETSHYCDLFTSQGCADGQACVTGADLKPQCVAAGTGGAGASCPCARGNTCFAVDGVATCHPFCHPTSDPSDCPAYTYCGSMGSIDQNSYGACFADCDLVHPNQAQLPFGNCPAGEACRFTTAGGAGCFAAGSTGEGFECTTPSECASALTCVNVQSVGYCLHLCRVAQGAIDCPSHQTCVSFATPSVLGGVEFGSCPP